VTFSQEAFDEALARALAAGSAPRFVVALSGGLDSTVALHALAGSGVPREVRAIHVDHGLHPDSPKWRAHCRRLCEAIGVAYIDAEVQAGATRGQSPEEAARDARYGRLRDEAAGGETIVTGHHADDQLETVLLQLFRGAGPAGLAAMPALARFGCGWLCRPLLEFRRAALAAWAEERELVWLEDPSNREVGYDRNYLRHEVLPAVNRRWPSAALSVLRSARHCADAVELMEAQADADLDGISSGGRPSVPLLAALSPTRQRNLLRRWLARRGVPAPDTSRMESILRNVVGARPDASPEVRWSGGAVRRYRDRLFVLDPKTLYTLDHAPRSLHWAAHDPLPLGPGLGTLRIVPANDGGLSVDWLADGPLEVRFRAGGEEIRPAGRGCTRAIKKLMQEAGIPPWWRGHIPLIWRGDRLLCVADLWSDEHGRSEGPGGWRVDWEDRPEFV
jgi:tRNA(Ile)-lysidine synthase